MSDPRSLFRFDPEELRAAVQAAEKRIVEIDLERHTLVKLVSTYRSVMRLHGMDPDRTPGLAPSDPKNPTVTITRVQTSREAPAVAAPSLKGLTIRKAAWTVLWEAPGKILHGKVLLDELARRGRVIGGKVPMQTLKAILRDEPLVRKEPEPPNTWRALDPNEQQKLPLEAS